MVIVTSFPEPAGISAVTVTGLLAPVPPAVIFAVPLCADVQVTLLMFAGTASVITVCTALLGPAFDTIMV
ncbi:hypothetical protein D3C71_1818520 [compost metagenome]